MRKHVEESVATGAAAGRGRGGRFSAGRKREVVMRLLRGEDLESVSRAVGITAARASHWRAQFLAAGQAGLKSRATDARDEDHRRLQAKIGELLMETELLYGRDYRRTRLWYCARSSVRTRLWYHDAVLSSGGFGAQSLPVTITVMYSGGEAPVFMDRQARGGSMPGAFDRRATRREAGCLTGRYVTVIVTALLRLRTLVRMASLF